MHAEAQEQTRQLVRRIVDEASVEEAEALAAWAAQLLALRAGAGSNVDKVSRAIALTAALPIVLPAARMMAREARWSNWRQPEQGRSPRLGHATIGRPMPGSSLSSLTALGTAIGVPHWIVTGEGAVLARALLSALDASPSIHHETAQEQAVAVA